ncbi:hypothetical protein ACWEQA_00690 [Nocardia sp. NPDC004085]
MNTKTLRAAAQELTQLYNDASRGAVHLDQLGELTYLTALVSEALGPADPGVEDPAILLQMLCAVDGYAKAAANKVAKANRKGQRQHQPTDHDIARAVGDMILLDYDADHGLVARRASAGAKVGTKGREMHDTPDPQRRHKLPAYRRSYVGYLWKTLSTSESRQSVLNRLTTPELIESNEAKVSLPGGKLDSDRIYSEENLAVAVPLPSEDWLRVAGHTQSDGPPILERTDYLAKVREWVDRDGRVLLLAGDSGNGKSTIARQALAGGAQAPSVYYIDAANVHSFTRTINRYLSGGSVVNIKEAVDRFVEMIARREGHIPAPIVFLDNVGNFSEVEPIAVWAPRTLITAEEKLIPNDFEHPHQTIDVEPLPVPLAHQLTAWFRPTESQDAVARFVHAVGCKPRIIVDCLGMFSADDMTLDEMSDLIVDEEARLIQQSGIGRRAVHRLYRSYFIRLESEDVLASLFLACIAHLGLDSVPMDICGRTLAEYVNANPEYGKLSAAAAKVYAQPLIRRYLITQDRAAIRVHGVTTQLFRDVTRDHRADVVRAFIAAYFEIRPRIVTESIGRMYPELVDWAPTICTILKQIPPAVLATIDRDQLNFLAADVRIGMRFLGRFEDYIEMVHTPNGISLGYIEYRELLYACYSFGVLDRVDFAQRLADFHDRTPLPTAELAINFEIARATYKMREFAADPASQILKREALRSPGDLALHKISMVVIICTAFEWLGIGNITRNIFDGINREEFSAYPAIACVLAEHAIEFFGNHGYTDMAETWYAFLSQFRDSSEVADSQAYEASIATGRAWIARSAIHEAATAHIASDAFVAAAHRKVRVGDRRGAARLYVEAVIIDRLFRLDYTDDPERRSLSQLLDSLDEPHLLCRLEIIDEFVSQAGSVYRLDLKHVADRTQRVKIQFQDARGYRMGVAAQVVLLRGRRTRKAELRSAIRELATQMALHRGIADEDEAIRWVEANCSDERFMLWM